MTSLPAIGREPNLSYVDLDDKVICSDCVDNKFVSVLITSGGSTDCPCSYCGGAGPTMEIGELAILFNREFQENYEIADNALREDHGFPSLGDDLSEIITQEISPAVDEIRDDLFELVRTIWEMEDFSGDVPDEGAQFSKTGGADHWLRSRWRDMQDSLRTQARFVNPEALEVIKTVFEIVDEDATESGEPLIVEIGPGHELSSLYRARVFQDDETLEDALRDPEAGLGPPPSRLSCAGRMNAKGVSVFYGANSPLVALAEVRPPVGSRVAIAEFKVIRSIRLLDLSRFEGINPIVSYSIFDRVSLDKARRLKFISQLESELIRPVMPSYSDDGYLITQVISDYLATHERLNLDGLIFRSAQVQNSEDTRFLNVTLFNKASVIKRSFKKYGREVNAHLFEMMEDGNDLFRPHIIYSENENELSTDWDFLSTKKPTLELVPHSIVIREIQQVNFDWTESPVELVDMSRSPWMLGLRS